MSLTCTLYIDYNGKFMFWGFCHDTKATDHSKPSSRSISQVKSKLSLEIDSKLWEIENILLLLDRKNIYFLCSENVIYFQRDNIATCVHKMGAWYTNFTKTVDSC